VIDVIDNIKFNMENKKNDIILIGEVLIDKITDYTNNETISIVGGSPANIARNLQRLNNNPVFVGSVGNDDYGKKIVRTLENEGLDLSFIQRAEGKTSFVEIDKSLESPKPKFHRFSDYKIRFNEDLKNAIENSKMVHFSYWPISKEPSKSTILKALQIAKEHNCIIGFDPNYHIDIDPSGGKNIDDILEMIKIADIVKPSLDDSIRIFGDGFSKEEYIKKYLDLGSKLVILTLGKDGLIASYNGEFVSMPSMATRVIDVTGAGDAFWSGLYTGILQGETIKDSLRLGLLCSAYNVQNVGALSVFPSVSDLKIELGIGG
jgi:fructokinase